MAINIEILDIFGVNDKVREGERAEKQSIVMAINIEILDILGFNDKVGGSQGEDFCCCGY